MSPPKTGTTLARLWCAVFTGVVWAACWVIIAVGHASPARAHAPYLQDVLPGPLVNGQRYSLALLFGDGIFAPDQMRPVVLMRKARSSRSDRLAMLVASAAMLAWIVAWSILAVAR